MFVPYLTRAFRYTMPHHKGKERLHPKMTLFNTNSKDEVIREFDSQFDDLHHQGHVLYFSIVLKRLVKVVAYPQ